MTKCLLPHCKNSSLVVGKEKFFRLPFWDASIKQKWLTALKLQEPVNPEESFICSLHFSVDCIEHGELKSGSIPTIDIQQEVKHNIDMCAIMEQEYSSIDEMKKEAECDLSFKIFGYTCRICGCSTENIENMESILDESNNLLEKIAQCLPVNVHKSDSLPLYMCLDCVDELEASYKLVQKALFTEGQLLEKLDTYTENTFENLEIEEDKTNLPMLDLEGPVTCDFCKEMFSNAFALNAHIEKEMQERDFLFEPDDGTVFHTVCSVCGQIFSSVNEYEAHKIEKVNKCSDCHEEFNSACNLIRHNTHKCQKKYYCSDCFKTFSSVNLLERHKEKHKIKDWYCYSCETQWSNSENFMKHSCVSIKPEIIEDNIGLNKHKELILRNSYGYKCALCDRTYKRHTNLAKHWATHDDYINHQTHCKHCNIFFNTRQSLELHMNKHHNKHKMFVCRFCGKAMTTKLSLNIHECIHMCIKPYICEWCGNPFRSKANLTQHQAKHTGVRKHECGVCGKMFSRKSFVTTHMRTHTGERPYSCDLCEQRFSQIGDMRRHRKRHDVIPVENKKNTDEAVEEKDVEFINTTQDSVLPDSIEILVKSKQENIGENNKNLC